jgi:hypothetical protein
VKGVETALKWYRRQWPDRLLKTWLVYWMALIGSVACRGNGTPSRTTGVSKTRGLRPPDGSLSIALVLRRLRRHPSPDPAVLYRLLHGLPEETLLIMIVKAESSSVKRQLLAFMTTYRYIKPLLTGIDLQILGVQPGPVFATVFGTLLEGRLKGTLSSADDEHALVRRVIRATTSRASRSSYRASR